MLVGERMSKPVISVSTDLPINEALSLMKRENIRRTPVLQNGKLVGIVSEIDLVNASPSPATSLSVWELNYLLSKITIKDVMTREVLTVTEDTPIENAARMMVDNKIGGMPVMRGDDVVGVITETDIFKILLELTGARETGVRATVFIQNEPGSLAKLTKAVADQGGDFIAFGQFTGDEPTNRMVTFKVSGLDQEQVRQIIQPFVLRIADMRIC
jgi:acetoin utilization protein AcuB